MQDNWPYILQQILKYEGGYVNDRRDLGGETNMGITKATAKANGYTGSMHTIPLSVVSDIYRYKFWTTGYYNGATLPSGLDLSTVDFGVNSGPARAGKYLKLALQVDTIAAIKALNKYRLGFLQSIRSWATFKSGWSKRVASVEALSVKLALGAQGKAPAEVSHGLQKEETLAKSERTKAVVKSTGAGSTEAVTQTHSWDWSHLLLIAGEVAIAALVVYFAYQIYIHHQRAQAYKAVA